MSKNSYGASYPEIIEKLLRRENRPLMTADIIKMTGIERNNIGRCIKSLKSKHKENLIIRMVNGKNIYLFKQNDGEVKNSPVVTRNFFEGWRNPQTGIKPESLWRPDDHN